MPQHSRTSRTTDVHEKGGRKMRRADSERNVPDKSITGKPAICSQPMIIRRSLGVHCNQSTIRHLSAFCCSRVASLNDSVRI